MTQLNKNQQKPKVAMINAKIVKTEIRAQIPVKADELIVDQDLQTSVEHASELRRQIEALTRQLNAEKEYIKDRCGETYKKVLHLDGTVAASISFITGGERINVKNLAASLPAVYARLQKAELITRDKDSDRVLIK